jgi:hypothetical protein
MRKSPLDCFGPRRPEDEILGLAPPKRIGIFEALAVEGIVGRTGGNSGFGDEIGRRVEPSGFFEQTGDRIVRHAPSLVGHLKLRVTNGALRPKPRLNIWGFGSPAAPCAPNPGRGPGGYSKMPRAEVRKTQPEASCFAKRTGFSLAHSARRRAASETSRAAFIAESATFKAREALAIRVHATRASPRPRDLDSTHNHEVPA